MKFYLDECHNTGNDWLNDEQPYFTYGGWIISNDKLDIAESILSEFQNKHQGELKSKSFVSHRGISKVIDLSEKLINKSKARPYFMCLEKKYMIACKIVEIFFDHKINSSVNSYLTFPNEYAYFEIKAKQLGIHSEADKEIVYNKVKETLPPIYTTKKALAEIINSDNELCQKVGEIIKDGIVQDSDIQLIINSLEKLFSNLNLKQISQIFILHNFDIKKLKEELSRPISLEGNEKNLLILFQPCLFEMISNIKDLHDEIELFPDSIGVSNFLYEEIARILKITITPTDSKTNNLIKASDLLVGQISRLLKEIIMDSPDVTENDLKLLRNTFLEKESILFREDTMWYYKFSYKSWEKVCNKLGYKFDKIDYNYVLDKGFHNFLKPSLK